MQIDPSPRRAITWRSLGLGLLTLILTVTITPYNDYVVNNSFIVGSYFPPVLTVSGLALVLLINGPLHKFAPRLALSPGELAVVLAIGLISCSIPSQGLLRALGPLPVAPFSFTGTDLKYRALMQDMHLPPWFFAVDSVATGHRESVVTAFYSRLHAGQSLPWGAWIRPAIGWGTFAFAFIGAMICIACVVRFQWAVNERLAFPIAQLQSMLVAPPEQGRAFNGIFANRLFWIALASVVFVQGSVAMHAYFPAVPAIPISYDLRPQLGDQPWATLAPWMKASPIYFTLLGISYFTPTRVSFSLWGTAVLVALIRWPLSLSNYELPGEAYEMQQTGAAFAFLGGLLWIGRHHWAVVWRALIGRPRANDAVGFYMRYRPAAIILIFCILVMFVWLLVAGCGLVMAIVILISILTAHIVTIRVVAETGLAFIRVNISTNYMMMSLPTSAFTPRDGFIYGAMHYVFNIGARESALGFGLHGLQVAELAGVPAAEKRKLPAVLMGSLVLSFVIGGAAALWCYYHYSIPLDNASFPAINRFGTDIWPRIYLVDFPTFIASGHFPVKQYSPWIHLIVGVVVTVILQLLSWRFTAWPLLPVGFLMCTSWYSTSAAFSLALGWLAKVLILRFGGAKLFNDMKPLFIGLIFGEAVSIAVWLIVTLILVSQGFELHITYFLPQ